MGGVAQLLGILTRAVNTRAEAGHVRFAKAHLHEVRILVSFRVRHEIGRHSIGPSSEFLRQRLERGTGLVPQRLVGAHLH